ncbi:hypothetical protein [Gemmobacter sp.]|uniref:hypothetical protein n=1 Tax=Gemmobacter sp. TaxID=1898957 RepID=UPI002AFEE0E9|nr:hypothetical protein [Gemmobacter sp.]
MRLIAAALIACLATPLLAAEPLDGAAFEARVIGQTFSFQVGGQSYGAEQYLPGRRVIWAFSDGPCREGTWSEPEPGRICFVYDHAPDDPQCWSFFDDDGRLRARFQGGLPQDDLIEARRSPAPLACPGPDLGA